MKRTGKPADCCHPSIELAFIVYVYCKWLCRLAFYPEVVSSILTREKQRNGLIFKYK